MEKILFFDDNSDNKDHELMLDYFLAWTLRSAQVSNEEKNVQIESKKILSHLLFGEQKEFVVDSVKTWKQWRQIDLCAEVIINMGNGETQKFAISYENKMYTHLHHDQLERYKTIFENY